MIAGCAWIIREQAPDTPGAVNRKGQPPVKPQKKFSMKEAQQLGDTLGVDWLAFGVDQFRAGLEVELEHGTRDTQTNVTDDDTLITGKIALAHLKEFPDYYTRLSAMEKEADEYWTHV